MRFSTALLAEHMAAGCDNAAEYVKAGCKMQKESMQGFHKGCRKVHGKKRMQSMNCMRTERFERRRVERPMHSLCSRASNSM